MIIDANLLAFSNEENGLYDKYNISFLNGKRIYEIDLNERRYDLSLSTPYRLNIMIYEECYTLSDTSWSSLIYSLFVLLQSKKPYTTSYLTFFELEWSSTTLFSYSKTKANSKLTPYGLYIYCGFIATHSFWVIRELLKLYNINRATLFISRPPLSEPEELTKLLTDKRRMLFRQYLGYFNKKGDLEIGKIITAIDSFNVLLTRRGYGYNNLYLIENSNTLSIYIHKLLDDIRKESEWSKKINVAEDYLHIFRRFANYVRTIYATFGQNYKSFNRCKHKASPIRIISGSEINIKTKSFVSFTNKNEARKTSSRALEIVEEIDLTIKYKNVTKSVLNIVSKSSVLLKAVDLADYLIDGKGSATEELKKDFPFLRASYRGVFNKKIVLRVINDSVRKGYLACDSGGFLHKK